MLLGLSDPATITVGAVIIAALFVLALLARVLFRNDPKPWRWRRIRIGLFVERETDDPIPRLGDERK